MTQHQCRGVHPPERTARKGHGPSSLWLHDPELIFRHLGLGPGMVFLDAGCGAGEYALYAADVVGENGRVIALDNVKLSIDVLLEEAEQQGLTNISGQACDITKSLPLESGLVDVILLSTVLPIMKARTQFGPIFPEFHRVLRPEGRLAVIECKKQDANFGPPKHMRLAEEDVEALVLPCGFDKVSELTMEETYLLCFRPRQPISVLKQDLPLK